MSVLSPYYTETSSEKKPGTLISFRDVTYLYYSWRSTDYDQAKQDLNDTVNSTCAAMIGSAASKICVDVQTGDDGFYIAYCLFSDATATEIAYTLSKWLSDAITNFNSTVTEPVVSTVQDFGKDAWSVAKILMWACIIILGALVLNWIVSMALMAWGRMSR